MSGDRRERKRLRMASHLSATAYELFETHGYDAVSMEQIADEADVAKATLYNYFPVKEALIAHRFREDVATGMAERAAELAAQGGFEARMRYLLRESAAWHSERKRYLPQYLRFLTSQAHYGEGSPNQPCHSDTRAILTMMFRAAKESGDLATQQSAEQIAWSFEYLLFGATAAWLREPTRSLSEHYLAAFDLLLHGVAAPANAHPTLPDRDSQ